MTMNLMIRQFAPPVAGLFLVALFVFLAFWQLDRAAEKKSLLDSFDGDTPFVATVNFESLADFDHIQVDGQFLGDRQVLIDNIPLNNRQGYNVITPFKTLSNDSLLLVNRGWIPKDGVNASTATLDVDGRFRSVRGLVGHLPRVGLRPGEAFEGSTDWPKVAVYPNLNEIATELGAAILPVVLLMSPDEDDGFARHWQPNTKGPMTHYGYAFQWFAMATTVLVILVWQLSKKRGRDTTTQ